MGDRSGQDTSGTRDEAGGGTRGDGDAPGAPEGTASQVPDKADEAGVAGEADEPAEHEPRTDFYETRVSPFVERFAADLTEAGMQRMASRVFACLLASRTAALSSTDLAERLQCSPAAISGAVRYLANLHLVSREREPGSRRERYHLHEDIWHETFLTRNRFVSRWSTTLYAGIETLGPDTPEGRRLAETTEFFDFLQEELGNMLERWRKHREETHGHAPPTP